MAVPTIADDSTNKTSHTQAGLTFTYASDSVAGIVVGSLLIAVIGVSAGGSTPVFSAAPAGWNKDIESIMATGSVRNGIAVFSHIVTDPVTDLSVTFDATPAANNNGMTGKLMRIAGHAPTGYIHKTQATAGGSNVTTYPITGVTTEVPDCLVLYCCSAAGARSFTESIGTELWEFNSAATNINSSCGNSLDKTTAGASGTNTFTPHTNSTTAGLSFAIASPGVGRSAQSRLLTGVG